MRQRSNPWEITDNLDWLEHVGKGILWAQGLVAGLLTLSLLLIGTGLYRVPVLTECVLRGALGRW